MTEPSERALGYDTETNGLLEDLDTVHSLCIEDLKTGERWSGCDQPGYKSARGDTVIPVEQGVEMLMKARLVVGHNIIGFDNKALAKVFPGFSVPSERVFDTYIASSVIWSDIKAADFAIWKRGLLSSKNIGRHTLDAWGERLGCWKGDYKDWCEKQGLDPWATWRPEMQDYCEQDMEVTPRLFFKIVGEIGAGKDWSFFDPAGRAAWPEYLRLEHEFAEVIDAQMTAGFPFDEATAADLFIDLKTLRQELDAQLQEAFPPKKVVRVFTPKASNSKLGYVKGKEHRSVKSVRFNPGSREHIAERFKEKYGWEPTEFTKGGENKAPVPVIDEDTLKALPYPEAGILARRFLIEKRIGTLGNGNYSLLKMVKEGRIHGRVTTNGTVTGRCTHSSPNIAQVPKVKTKKDENGVEHHVLGEAGAWGYEFRSLFIAPAGWVQIGTDASGLELRCLAHFMGRYDGGAYGEILLNGDIHSVNQEAAGLPSRDNAKTFIYAFLYGAGDEKIGSIVAPLASPEEKRKIGAELRRRFLAGLPALKKLQSAVKGAARTTRFLYGLDRRTLPIRSDHAALNTLLQSAGSIIVKKATVLAWDGFRAAGLKLGDEVRQVAHVHDEIQHQALLGLENQVAAITQDAFRRAGEHFNFRCPIAGESKIGRNWAETH